MAEPGVKDFETQYNEVLNITINTTSAPSSGAVTLQIVKDILNEKMRTYQASEEHLWARRTDTTTTLATSTSVYTLIANCRKIIRIVNTTKGQVMRFMPRGEYERLYPKRTSDFSNGLPTWWTYVDPDTDLDIKVLFGPSIPTAAENGDVMELTYLKHHVDLSATTDTSDIPVTDQQIPIWEACSEVFIRLNMPEEASVWQNKADQLKRTVWKERQNQPDYVDTPIDYYQGQPQHPPYPINF